MKIKLLILVFISYFNSCKSQDLKECEAKVEYKFSDKKAKHSKNVILVLETGFDDYIKIYLNNQLIKEGKFETDREFGTAGEIIDYNYNESLPVFRIELDNNCLIFKTIKGYKIIFLHKVDNKWIVEYRNTFNQYE